MAAQGLATSGNVKSHQAVQPQASGQAADPTPLPKRAHVPATACEAVVPTLPLDEPMTEAPEESVSRAEASVRAAYAMTGPELDESADPNDEIQW